MVKVGFLGLGLKTVSRAHRGSSENTGVYHHGHKTQVPHYFRETVQTPVIYDIVVFMVNKMLEKHAIRIKAVGENAVILTDGNELRFTNGEWDFYYED